MKWFYHILFFIIVAGLSFYYGYDDILQLKPQGGHVWRQTDGASIAMNYYQHSMDLFEPQMHNLFSGSSKTVGEFPIIYYIAAICYHLFGPDEFWLRLISSLIYITGIYFIFRFIYLWIKDLFWSFFTGLLFFTSPLLLFYGNNFLPDVPAFGLSMIGSYGFFRFYFNKHIGWLWFSSIFFSLAGLIKVSALIPFLAVGIVLLFINKKERILNSNRLKLHSLLAGIFVILNNISWYSYATWYKKAHNNFYLLTTIRPIWEKNWESISYIWTRIKTFWSSYFFHDITLWLIIILTLFLLIVLIFKRNRNILTGITFISLIGILSFSVLWFPQYLHHDYYFITLFCYPAFLITAFLYWLKRDHLRVFNSNIVKVVMVVFLSVNVIYAKDKLHEKYNNYKHENPSEVFYNDGFKQYLSNIGVGLNDTVLSLPDGSTNRTLYLMNRSGFTRLTFTPDSAGIGKKINKGAEYLILADTSFHIPEFFLQKPVGRFENVYIYKLPEKRN